MSEPTICNEHPQGCVCGLVDGERVRALEAENAELRGCARGRKACDVEIDQLEAREEKSRLERNQLRSDLAQARAESAELREASNRLAAYCCDKYLYQPAGQQDTELRDLTLAVYEALDSAAKRRAGRGGK